jgi:hypothetical protein
MGTVFKIDRLPAVETPEAMYLGMTPREGQMRQGPLTVAALGADPPERSTHFHLSWLSLEGDRVFTSKFVPSPEEERAIWERAKVLDTRSLTQVRGEGIDHALVWEGLGDFQTYAPSKELSYREHLPQGDAEVQLRRLIDDSVNVLSDLEVNQKRIDEGLPPFNILWPWGEGTRARLPNLSLRRGAPATVESASLRLQGLTRLAGYTHVQRGTVGAGLNTKFSKVAKRCLGRDLTLALLDPSGLTLEEKEWWLREFDREFISPLLDDVLKQKSQLTVLCPNGEQFGLGVSSSPSAERELPFDERAFEEKGIQTRSLNEAVDQGLVL